MVTAEKLERARAIIAKRTDGPGSGDAAEGRQDRALRRFPGCNQSEPQVRSHKPDTQSTFVSSPLLRFWGEQGQGLASHRAEGVQLGQRAALYCRVSTADQSCERQERDLAAFAQRAGYEVVGIYKETASGVKLDRAERSKVMALAQARQLDAVLVTELSPAGVAARPIYWPRYGSWKRGACRSSRSTG